MFAQRSLPLPTVANKNDAQANQNDTSGSKLPVADSLVLLQSLKQSRTQWLTKAFLRFSTRSKEKADQVHPAPPPHSLSLAGTCDVEIGPHLFPQTKIFFVQYRYGVPPAPATSSTPAPASAPTPAPAPTPTTHTAPITVSHELHAKVLAAAAKDPELHHILQLASQGRANVTQLRTLGTSIKAIEAGTYPSVAPPSAPASTSHTPAQSGQAQSAPAAQTRSAPSASPASVPASTPAAASTVASTATSTQAPTPAPKPTPTPTLAPAPTAAPAPKPTPAPTLAPTPTAAPAPASVPTQRPTAPAPVHSHAHVHATPAIPTTAVLLEFAERPIDRWLLPTEYVLLDRRPNDDVLLSTFYPFDAYVPSGGAMRSKPAHPLTMRFVAASSGVWSALSRTCTTVSPSTVQSILGEVISNIPPRTYLQYRIAPGSMWEDLKAANPTAQAFLLPSTTPMPTTTARQRRADGTTGNPTKKRKTDAGDSTGASTPREPNKSKGKGKEKETGPADASAKPLVSAPQPSNVVPVVTHNAPVPPQAVVPPANTTATPTPVRPVSTVHPPLNTSNPPKAGTSVTPYPPVTTSIPYVSTTGASSVYSASGTPTPYTAHSSAAPTTSNTIGPSRPAVTTISPPQSHPAQTSTPTPGTLNQALPPQPPPSVTRAPVQHVPGEGAKVMSANMGANPSSLEK